MSTSPTMGRSLSSPTLRRSMSLGRQSILSPTALASSFGSTKSSVASPKSTHGHPKEAAHSLVNYFQRKLGSTYEKGDVSRIHPLGYRLEFRKERVDTAVLIPVLLHEASGVHVLLDALDFVERVDRRISGFPARILFVYFRTSENFGADKLLYVTEVAQKNPHEAWAALVKGGVITKVASGAEELDGSRHSSNHNSEDIVWCGGATAIEPSAVVKLQEEQTWSGADLCLALHVPAPWCRPAECGSGAYSDLEIEILWPPTPTREMRETQSDLQLMEAVKRRDEILVRSLLQSGASANWKDSRGWTPLHLACAIRPRMKVVQQLLREGDPCARTHHGDLASDLADFSSHEDVAKAMKERMMLHETAQHLPQASAALGASARIVLGLPPLDESSSGLKKDAAKKGRRLQCEAETEALLTEFAKLVMEKYEDSDKAFETFDINGNGTLSVTEFAYYVRLLRFPGDPAALFKALDEDRLGDISVGEFRLLQRLYEDAEVKRLHDEKVQQIEHTHRFG